MAVAMGCRVIWRASEARAGAPHATHAACRGYRLCAGGYRTVSAAEGVMLSTIRRLRLLVAAYKLVDLKVDEPNVKTLGAGR